MFRHQLAQLTDTATTERAWNTGGPIESVVSVLLDSAPQVYRVRSNPPLSYVFDNSP